MNILLVGETGFIGSAFRRRLSRLPDVRVQVYHRHAGTMYSLDAPRFTHIINCADSQDHDEMKNLTNKLIGLQITDPRFVHAKLVYFSSLLAYDAYDGVISNDFQLLGDVPEATREYGEAKRKIIHDILTYSPSYTNYVLGNVYGERDRSNRVIPSMLRSIEEHGEIRLQTNGAEHRTFMYVDDVVDGVVKSLRENLHPVSGNVYVGTPNDHCSIYTIAKELALLAGNVPVVIGDKRGKTRIIHGERWFELTSRYTSLLRTIRWHLA